MANFQSTSNIDPAIFQCLQDKIDEEGRIRDALKEIVQPLEKQGRTTQSILSRIHNTPTHLIPTQILDHATPAIAAQCATLLTLSALASQHPFHKYHPLWSHQLQSLLTSMQLQYYLEKSSLLTPDQVSTLLQIPVNVKDRDVFHVTLEDYLLALTSTVEELARLAPNSVTMGDYARPVGICRFVKDVHAGFQLLNLKNDSLRRRSDGIKYSVKKVEDVVYDLSLRGLVPTEGQNATMKTENSEQ